MPGATNKTLRDLALGAIKETEWVPETGQNCITGMIAAKPDWVMSRQRAWGVPITIFRNTETDEIAPGPQFAKSSELIERIEKAFHEKGADVWFEAGAKERFLKGLVPDAEMAQWEQVKDVLDVWFDSGSTHAFVLDDPEQFPSLAGIKRKVSSGGGQAIDTRHVPRGLGPASRLVPFLAAGILRHSRPRPLRRRAHARLHPRREGG